MKYLYLLIVYLMLQSQEMMAQIILTGVSLDSIYFDAKSWDTPLGEGSNYSFYYYKPVSYNPLTSPILFAIHGDGGNGLGAINDLDSIAEHRHALIVAPNLQTSGSIHIQLAYYQYLDSILLCTVYGPATDVFKAIYRHVLQRENRVAIPSYMIGFSAGGQFVTRYMLIRQAYPDSIPLQMAVSSNPAYYTFPTDTFNGAAMPWACGLIFDTIPLQSDCSNAPNFFNFNCTEHIIQYYNENYGVLIGTGDNQPYGSGCMLDEGVNRYERALTFYNYADSNAVTLGTTLQWPYVEIPGIGHSQNGMYNTKVNIADSSTIAETLLFDTPYHNVPSLSPFANFYPDTTLVGINGTVNFTNASTLATNYWWDFGDNSTSAQINPSHTYTTAGIYTVQLTAINNTGCDSWTVKRRYITVTGSIPGTAEKFQKRFGATGLNSTGVSAQQTNDNGYISFGTTNTSIVTGSDWIYIVKMQGNGDTLWSKMFGGSNAEFCEGGQQTYDDGYVAVGYTTSFGAGGKDFYLVKTDSIGNLLWSKTYGGILDDWAYSVQQTKDSGYIISGGNSNALLVKTDINGDTMWTKRYNFSAANSALQTKDGGYILTGQTNGSIGGLDIALIKTDMNGNVLWSKAYGGGNADIGYSVRQTNDNGFIISGITSSFGNINYDIYLIKTDSIGNLVWSKTYGSGYNQSVAQSNDGGYLICGSNNYIYLVKTNDSGNTLWAKEYATLTNGGLGNSVRQTNDGGYVVAAGSQFVSIIKTDSLGNSGCNEVDTNFIAVTPATQFLNFVLTLFPTGFTVTSPATIVNSGGMVNTLCTSNVGVAEALKDNTSINIYPNPTTGSFIITSDNIIKKGLVIIYNIFGEKVYRKNILNESLTEINLKNISSGIYFVKVFDEEKNYSKKLIVE